jgi:transcriptional regulator with GAF, ATPase, and Fis domain
LVVREAALDLAARNANAFDTLQSEHQPATSHWHRAFRRMIPSGALMTENGMTVLKAQSWTYHEVAPLSPAGGFEDNLLAAVRKLTATLDVGGVCEAVLCGVENVFGATSSWIMLHDQDANVLRTALFRGRGADAYGGVEIPADCGIAGLVFTRGEIQFVPDAASDPRWFDPERIRASGLRSVFILPLIAAQKTIGVLGLDSPRFGPTRAPTPLDVKWLEVFAAQAAIGLGNARRYQLSQQDRARLRELLRERRALRQEVLGLRDAIRNAYSFGPIVGESEGMAVVLSELEQVAGSDVTVLLLGETGTGKELLARALHERSRRSARPFVPVNCAALPEHLVESEMFGYERGAFTGAHARKVGRFELAHRGTLFLDEIGDLPLNAQAKLLRVLQDGEVYRVGSTQPTRVDVRVVAATNQDLAERVTERTFRDDLFYRLSVFPIRIPPLRDRAEDIPLLAAYLAGQCARRMGRSMKGIAQDALAALTSYPWPGNVRELQNVMERAVILATDGLITADQISLNRMASPAAAQPVPAAGSAVPSPPAAGETSPPTLADAERVAIIRALRQAEGRVSGPAGAAAILGLKPTTLHAKMKKLGVQRRDALRL